MHSISWENICARGEIGARAGLLYARLEGVMYRPEDIFTVESGGWPGDWEGRTILALTMLARTTGKEPAYLDEIVEKVHETCNEKGYMRQILPAGDLDEQQLSGHSWLLRGLCEYYLFRRDNGKVCTDVLARIEDIVENLFLGAAGQYAVYPVKPEERISGGAESGHIGGKIGHWYISSDTGCAYIPLDGVSQAYVLLDTYSEKRELVAKTKLLLDEMVAHFYKIPFLDICVQTHATLTACRGILRLYEKDGDETKLSFVREIFKLYTSEGMSANFANYNWFGRPEWTEPCAIIDSFMLAAQLFLHTGKLGYREMAQKILYNGIYAGQRANGGFGTDNCTGAEAIDGSHMLGVSAYEAYWCCSMRGGEGLAAVSRYALMENENGEENCSYDNTVTVFIPMDGIYTVHGVTVLVRTTYPAAGSMTFRILENPENKRLFINIPQMQYCTFGANGFTIREGEMTVKIQPKLHTETPMGNHNGGSSNGKNWQLLLNGYSILGTKNENVVLPADAWCDLKITDGKNWHSPDGTVFSPISERYLKTASEIAGEKIRILF